MPESFDYKVTYKGEEFTGTLEVYFGADSEGDEFELDSIILNEAEIYDFIADEHKEQIRLLAIDQYEGRD